MPWAVIWLLSAIKSVGNNGAGGGQVAGIKMLAQPLLEPLKPQASQCLSLKYQSMDLQIRKTFFQGRNGDVSGNGIA